MAQYKKSLKLVNKATIDAFNNLQLYCELDHFFLPGDRVVINGGFYDNISDASFTTYNPYVTPFYTVLATDPTQNRITLDLKVPGTLYFPYAAKGATTNVFGDPTDLVDAGYNYYNISGNRDLFKDVYISLSGFVRGKFKKGVIQDGIFGCDKNKTELNDTLYNGTSKAKLNVNHIAAKNVKIPAGIINSKTFGSGNVTNKIAIQENISQNFPVINIPTGVDNNGYGYSYFEKAKLGDSINPANYYIDINNSWLKNSGATLAAGSNIEIWSATVNGSKFGDNYPMEYDVVTQLYGAMQLHDLNLVNGNLGNVFTAAGDRIELNGGIVNNSIPIKGGGGLFNATYGPPGYIFLNVDYKTVANQFYDPTFVGVLSGVVISATGKTEENFFTIVEVQAATYAYGTEDVFPLTATLTLYFPFLAGIWATIQADYPFPSFDLDWSKVTIYNLVFAGSGPIFQNCLFQGNLVMNTFLAGNSYPFFTDVYVRANAGETINITGGFYIGVPMEGNVNVTAPTAGDTVFFEGCQQITGFGQKPTFQNTILRGEGTRTGDFTNCIINAGIYSECTFVDSIIRHQGTVIPTFLYGCDIRGYTRVDDDPQIDWENCSFEPIINTYLPGSPPTLVPGGAFKDRKFRFTTSPDIAISNLPLPIGAKALNTNNKKTTPIFASPPPDTTEGVFQISTPPVYIYQAAVIPHSKGFLAPSSLNLLYTLYDVGDDTFDGFFWNPQFNRNRVMVADLLSNNFALDTVLNNVDTNNFAFTYDTRFTTPPLYNALPGMTLFGEDTNFLYTTNGYYKTSKVPTNMNSIASIFENDTTYFIPGQTQLTGNIPNIEFIFTLLTLPTLAPTFALGQYTSPAGSPLIINTGIPPVVYDFEINWYAWQNIYANPSTLFPNSFIEIEGYTISREPAGGGTIYDQVYIPMGITLGGDYMDWNLTGVYPNNIPIGITVGLSPNERLTIEFDIWVTPYIAFPYIFSGAKKRYPIVYKIENP